MKKIITFMLIFTTSLCILCGCKVNAMPVPEYPLDTDTIDKELKIWGLTCTIEADELSMIEGERSLYNINDAESGKFVFGVLSGQKDEERVLFISFLPFYSDEAVPSQECEMAIAFATRLFGGFESEHQVYDKFIQDYDTVNTKKEQFETSIKSTQPKREGESYWESDIGNITCRIVLEQPKLSEPQEYLNTIIFATDWDTFYSE